MSRIEVIKTASGWTGRIINDAGKVIAFRQGRTKKMARDRINAVAGSGYVKVTGDNP